MLDEFLSRPERLRRSWGSQCEYCVMCDLRARDFVECVDDRANHPLTTTMPERGKLYTVASTRAVGDGYSVRLNELTPDCWRGGTCQCGECGWDSARFRRVYRPDPARIEAFRSMLIRPPKVTVRAVAEAWRSIGSVDA